MKYRKDFPVIENNPDMVYLDSGATSLKPRTVIDMVNMFYEGITAPVHRSTYANAEKVTKYYEASRLLVKRFINAKHTHEIVFTKNTNESLNLAANYFERRLKEWDIIVLSTMEHNSNIIPWRRIAEKKKAKIFYLPYDKDFRLDWRKLLRADLPKDKIKVVSLTHASNVLGTINPIKEIITEYRNAGINARFVVDGAQAIPHFPVDVKDLDCDFYAFSGHKMLAPSGVGVLYGKQEVLDFTDPLIYGSHMVEDIEDKYIQYGRIPDRLEAGTPNIEGVIGLGAAIGYLEMRGMRNIQKEEQALTEAMLSCLSPLKSIKLYGSSFPNDRLAIFSFSMAGLHAHDVAQILGSVNICVRAGHHCAIPLIKTFDVPAVTRASLYFYNDLGDIERFIKGLSIVEKTMGV